MADQRLLIIAADPLARAGLATLLDDQPEMRIIGQIGSSNSISAEINIHQPDVILWDMGWDAQESLEQLEDLDFGADANGPFVLALIPDNETAAAAYSSGVQGMLFREVSAGRLSAAAQAVAWGLTVIDPEIMAAIAPSGLIPVAQLVEELSERELEVLALLAEGLSNRAIAQELSISDHTVKFHVNGIMGKLGAQSRTAAVVQAMRLGYLTL